MLQVEQLGTEGKVEEAQGVMKLVEQLKEERELASRNVSTVVCRIDSFDGPNILPIPSSGNKMLCLR